MNQDIDAISRNRIVAETDENFFVEAGAGSGKTTMLVNRMVAMVEQGKDIRKICAITFTKAAALEFYERFQKLLTLRSNKDIPYESKGYAGELPAPTEESRKRCFEALQNIDLCFMGTIDSFCNMLLSEHPSEAQVPSDCVLYSEEEAKLLWACEYVKIANGTYGMDLATQAKEFRKLYWNPKDVFLQGMGILMNQRNVEYQFHPQKFVDLDQAYGKMQTTIRELMDFLCSHKELAYPKEQKNLAAWEVIDQRASRLKRPWSSDFYGVVRALDSLKNLRIVLSDEVFVPASIEGLFIPYESRGKVNYHVIDVEELVHELTEYQYHATMSFLAACVPVVERAMHDKGAMTYFDYLYYLRNMLMRDAKKDGTLISYIAKHHSYFLIDEFQDTNPLQAEVFFYLSAQKVHPQWDQCQLRPGSLFIVGDPKQSIYRFRSADVTSFLRVKSLFQANAKGQKQGDVLLLLRNFRSTSGLTKYFNRVFANLLSTETKYQSKFIEIPEPPETESEFQGVYSYRALSSKITPEKIQEVGYEVREGYDYEQIPRIIQSLVHNPKYKVRGGSSKDLHELEYEDFMVITYGKRAIEQLSAMLHGLNIPVHVEGQVAFAANEALFAIYEIYTCLACPKNGLFLKRCLEGPVYRVTEEALIGFRQDGGRLSLQGEQNLSDQAKESSQKIASIMESLKEEAKEAQKLSPVALFTKILEEKQIYSYVEAKDLEVVYYTLELLRSGESKGEIRNIREGASYLTTLLSGESKEERCLSLSENHNAVHLANLHKVKGLEAPVVILASAADYSTQPELRVEHGIDGAKGYLFILSGGRDASGVSRKFCATDAYGDQKEEESIAMKAERERLLYVAATRARNTLIISNTVVAKGKGFGLSSIWKELLEEVPDYWESQNLSWEEPLVVQERSKEEVEAEELYGKAEKESVWNKHQSVVVPTYGSKNPSREKISSKMHTVLEEEQSKVDLLSYSYPLDEGDPVSQNPGPISSLEYHERAMVHRYPTLLGSSVHRLMEVLVSSRNQVNLKECVEQIVKEYGTPQNLAYQTVLTKALLEAGEVMRSQGYPQKNAAPQNILETLLLADEVYCEVPFCYEEEHTIWNGIMDVIYCKDGKWHIIDYKTNAEGSNLDQHYAGQLEAYKKALKVITGVEAEDAMIYHLDL